MLNRAQKTTYYTLGIIFFLFVIFFAYHGYASYRKGPYLKEINFDNGTYTVQKPSWLLKASVENTQKVKINGRDILLHNNENIEEELVFASGDNIIEILLTDAFGKEKKYEYHIFYQKEESEPLIKTLQEAREIQKQREEDDFLDEE